MQAVMPIFSSDKKVIPVIRLTDQSHACDVADICIEREVPCFLGAATPTEVLAAHEAGAAAVKVFPAAQLGGPGFLKAVKSVFPHIALMPTGGIGSGDIADYFAAGACCIGMGGRLVDEQAMNDGRPGDISKAAWEVLDALAAVKAGNGA